MAVLHRRILRSEDYVLSVQGGSHLQKRQTVSHFLHRFSIAYYVIDLAYLRCEIAFDEVLITLHLDRAVTSDSLMVVAWNRIVEGIHADIKYAIIKRRVLENQPVDRTRVVCRREVARSDEMVLVEIALADRDEVEVDKEDHSHADDDHPALAHERAVLAYRVALRGLKGPYEERAGDGDKPERMPCVLAQKRLTVRYQGIHEYVRLTCIYRTGE